MRIHLIYQEWFTAKTIEKLSTYKEQSCKMEIVIIFKRLPDIMIFLCTNLPGTIRPPKRTWQNRRYHLK